MEPLTIITSILQILSGVASASKGIQHLANLPKAFQEVNRRLPLAQDVLQEAKNVFGKEAAEDSKACKALKECEAKATSLSKIFEELTKANNDTPDNHLEWSTSKLAAAYRDCLLRLKKTARANKVEKLMRDIMETLHTLATLQVFQNAIISQAKMDALEASIAALSTVAEQDPSIKDEELLDDWDQRMQQTINDNGTGYQNGQNTNLGSGYMPVSFGGQNSFGSHATNNYGDVHNNHAAAASPASEVRWIVPRQASKLFTGRDEIMKVLKERLSNARSPPARVVMAITGLGGMGKSEICLKIAEQMRDEFWAVFWVDASSPKTAQSSFNPIGEALGLPSGSTITNDTLRALANTKEYWLLILDNADDINFDYAQYIPSGTYGTVIITSRNPECEHHSTVPASKVEAMDVEHATHLLLTAAKLPEEEWASHEEHVRIILEDLGSHTLALIQAGAYIAADFCRLDEYHEKFQKTRKRLLEYYPEQGKSPYGSVYATFEMSANFLETSISPDHSHVKVNRYASELLGVLSMLHSNDFPFLLFKAAWQGAKSVEHKTETVMEIGKNTADGLPSFIDVKDESWDDHKVKLASHDLTLLSLVTTVRIPTGRARRGYSMGLSMHPLAHAWAKDRLHAPQKDEAWMRTGTVLALSRCGKAAEELWEDYEEQLRLHLIFFLSQRSSASVSADQPASSLYPPESGRVSSRRLSSCMELILIECGFALEGMDEQSRLKDLLLQQLCLKGRIVAEELENSRFWRLVASNLLNGAHSKATKKAIEILENFDVPEEAMHPTDPRYIQSRRLRHDLAWAYLHDGQTQEAMKLFGSKLVGTGLEIGHQPDVGEPYRDHLKLQRNIAIRFAEKGETDTAIRVLLFLITNLERHWDATNSRLLNIRHELALAYSRKGELEKAMSILLHIVKVRKTTLEETDPDRLAVEKDLGLLYRNIGHCDTARDLLGHVVETAGNTPREQTEENSHLNLPDLKCKVEELDRELGRGGMYLHIGGHMIRLPFPSALFEFDLGCDSTENDGSGGGLDCCKNDEEGRDSSDQSGAPQLS